MSNFKQQLQKMKTHSGFIVALDQSGGSTPKALSLYGIKENSWSNEDEMFAIVHQMRTRIITSSSFTGERILAAILFENTMDRDIEGQPTADYLWNVKRVVPFLKVDKGLAAEKTGVQLMKAMPGLPALLDRAKSKRIFGTKMRSVIKQANAAGINEIAYQQFEAARQMPDVDFYVTGDSRRITPELLAAKPDNCHLTGFVPYEQYIGLLRQAGTIVDLTTRNHTLLMGGFEAVSLGTPLVTSDWPILREYFSRGTVHVANNVAGVRDGVRYALENEEVLRREMVDLKAALETEWQRSSAELWELVHSEN